MKIVTMKEYYEAVGNFVNKHEIANVSTSNIVNGDYHKTYMCEDGATGWEINRVIYETRELEVKGLNIKVSIKLLETEWFDTDNGKSIYMYNEIK